jgi:hypothetical protein
MVVAHTRQLPVDGEFNSPPAPPSLRTLSARPGAEGRRSRCYLRIWDTRAQRGSVAYGARVTTGGTYRVARPVCAPSVGAHGM